MILAMGTKASVAQNVNGQVILQVCGSGDPYHHGKHLGREMQRHLQVYLEGNKLSFDETGQPFTFIYIVEMPLYIINMYRVMLIR